ncbi:MAG: 30S ribosomal protein S6 [Sedimentisphaerales bacterium]|nr:30S ribosomal protein S6 [Planctomycetota bacterium]MDY0354902.1 30S ribosomal protein S6 [Sedimentisphaerales bacterium]NLT76929.1 30S ribosomal protein S6 [Planctomycetota bacterium]
METGTKRLYEGMFLVDSAQAAADWEGTLSVINTILQRADAEVVSMRKWQERKLTYDIDHKSRGTYILCYFNVDGRRISGIEKDVLLSEKVMRALILTTEKRPAEMIERDITGEPAPSLDAPESAETSEGARRAPTPAPAAEVDTAVEDGGDNTDEAAE